MSWFRHVGWLLRRLALAGLALLALSALLFVLLYVFGSPVDSLISPDAEPDQRLRAVAALGLEQPLWGQYLSFLRGLANGELGRSFTYNEPAMRLVLGRMPATLELTGSAVVAALLIGLPLGLYAGLRPHALLARLVGVGAMLGFSMPGFWAALMLIELFSVKLGLLPTSGRGETALVCGVRWSVLTLDGVAHLILPALSLALFNVSLVLREARAGVRQAMQLPFLRYARARGLPPRRIALAHVGRIIVLPVLRVLGLELGSTIALSVVTENIFAWPGMGKLIIDSINVLDRPVIVAYLVIVVVMVLGINLLVDLLARLLDPAQRVPQPIVLRVEPNAGAAS